MKPSGFLANSTKVAEALAVRCNWTGRLSSRAKGGRHAPCPGHHAEGAAKYPRQLRRSIIRGTARQLRGDNRLKDCCFGIHVHDEDASVEARLQGPAQGYNGKSRDDLTGQTLKDPLVQEARAKELGFLHSEGVWAKRPRAMARAKTGRPPISLVGWISARGTVGTPITDRG